METNVKVIRYLVCNEMIPISLDALYEGDSKTLENLRYNLSAIINTEAPITLNLIKARLREAFNVKKISGKALEIIERELKRQEFPVTDNLFDLVYWPEDGIYAPKFIRVGYERQIYDIPYQEMVLLAKDYISKGLHGEALYRAILAYYGYEVLTEKAQSYLAFVESKAL